MDTSFIIHFLQQHFPNVMAIYAFGSRTMGMADVNSDLDLAILVEGYAEPLKLWEQSNQLANELGMEVDLLDFRATSTVMQYQILTHGERLWSKDLRADLYEAAVLSEKTNLDEARADLIQEINKDGHVYAR
ncbi:MAG: nucleotidyltransferase domain-containing protein [Oceanospirillales bacterium]|nr:MAG: nucleotidyltransferase domain-containing protein [Oceanospirillales bacterium]